MSSPRTVDVARLCIGVVGVVRPQVMARLSTDGGSEVRGMIRLLGARYVLQSSAALGLRRPWIRRVGAGVDLTHATTMLALAAVAPAHRRLALLSAATATIFAATDLKEKMR